MKFKSAIIVILTVLCCAITAFADTSVTTDEAGSERYEADIRAINANSSKDIAFSPVSADAPKGGKRTVFIFMIGSDMARYAEYDICEMLRSGFNSADTNVILIAGGSDGWSIDSMKKHPVNVFRLTAGGFASLNETKEYNIFDADDIYAVMFKYMARYRAEQYSVLFWDHGGGFVNGFGKDASNVNGSITAEKLAKVFTDIRSDVKNDFDLDYNYEYIGFDACYMADVQTAKKFADAGFKYFIGSEDIENYSGWNYSFLSALNSEAKPLHEAIIDDTSEFYGKPEGGSRFTLSCMDLSKAGNVMAEIEKTAAAVNSAKAYDKYLSARCGARVYGNPGIENRFGGSSHDYVDIKDFAGHLTESGIDASGLSAAVADMMVYNRSSDEYSGGVTVYSYYSSDENSLKNWLALTDDGLKEYKELQLQSHSAISGYEPSPIISEGKAVSQSGGKYSYSMSESEAANTKAVKFCVYSLENGIYRKHVTLNDAVMDGKEISVGYDNKCARLVNGENTYPCAAEFTGGSYEIVLAKDMGGGSFSADYSDIAVTVDSGGNVSDTRYVNSGALASKDDAKLRSGDRVFARISAYTEDNRSVEEIPDIFTMHDTSIRLEDLTGVCYGRFEMTNAYGYVQYYSPMTRLLSETEALPEIKTAAAGAFGGNITAGGAAVSVPCTAEELERAGFGFIGEPVMTASGDTRYMTMRGPGGYIDVTLKNFSTDSLPSDKCVVTGISSDNAEYAGIRTGTDKIPEGFETAYESRGLTRYIYKLGEASELPDFESSDLGRNGMYINGTHDYVVIEVNKSSGVVQRIGINSENGCEMTVTSPKRFEAEYDAPEQLGYNAYSFVFKMDGALYRLPMPVKELTRNGWTFEISAKAIPSYGSAEATAEKNGMKITAELVNYSESAAAVSDCIVCGLYIDYNMSAPEMILSGGMDLKKASENVAKNNSAYVSEQAGRFMTLPGTMLYTTGKPLDYSGEIAIYSDGVYMYKRYNDLRSMSEFDTLARYFVY